MIASYKGMYDLIRKILNLVQRVPRAINRIVCIFCFIIKLYNSIIWDFKLSFTENTSSIFSYPFYLEHFFHLFLILYFNKMRKKNYVKYNTLSSPFKHKQTVYSWISGKMPYVSIFDFEFIWIWVIKLKSRLKITLFSCHLVLIGS